MWMRAQNLADQGGVAEDARNVAEAERLYGASVALLEANYPDTAVLLSARGRLAGFYARTGQEAKAEALFREIVKGQANVGVSQPALARVLQPYVEILLKKGNDPHAVADLFDATQAIVRPGVAETQAILARELSGGSDEASRLFRQAVNLDRQIERQRLELARLEATPAAADRPRMNALRIALIEAQKDQVATQSRLADFPRFRAVSNATLPLSEVQNQLREGEAYYKMTVVGDRVYALLATPKSARAVRIDASAKDLQGEVDSLRETISTVEDGKRQTFPFDVGLARKLYVQLFQPFDADLAGVRQLVFEPDGAMLRLPPNLLIASDAGMDAYRKRAEAGADAEFDFTGLQWLGRDRDVTTSVSARALPRRPLGARGHCPARISRPGQQCAGSGVVAARQPRLRASAERLGAPDLGQGVADRARHACRGRPDARPDRHRRGVHRQCRQGPHDLDQYRVIHFATHGIVTPPQARCPAQPALLTSFGGPGSDGLLTFREIFDLQPRRRPGDPFGLRHREQGEHRRDPRGRYGYRRRRRARWAGARVRRRGGRTVLASHWPVPDDYNATQRLITGLFSAPSGTPICDCAQAIASRS